jgi:adenosylcobinamide kinase/adenosylcobinamide-phosphate guanylyltransferase
MTAAQHPRHELILGGVRSGKSRTAEARAAAWLAGAAQREAVLVATALPGDAEMAKRIARHRAERAACLPALATREVPRALPQALRELAAPQRLVVVDCLTLWLTQCLLPSDGAGLAPDDWQREQRSLLDALAAAAGPVVLVSNEIGLGVMPLSSETRRFVDALGVLHQQVGERCARVTLLVAGIEFTVKAAE